MHEWADSRRGRSKASGNGARSISTSLGLVLVVCGSGKRNNEPCSIVLLHDLQVSRNCVLPSRSRCILPHHAQDHSIVPVIVATGWN